MLSLPVIAFALGLGSYVWADQTLQENTRNTILYDGLIPLNFTVSDLDNSDSPYVVVKGTQDDSQYFHFLSPGSDLATILWGETPEQVISVTIDNTSIVTQDGSLRSQLIAQRTSRENRIDFDAGIEANATAFHLSVQVDPENPLDYTKEYLLMSIELSDGTNAFAVKTGTPPNTTLPENGSNMLSIFSHSGTNLFQTSFDPNEWHNIAVVVDWSNLTLQVFYSTNGCILQDVTDVVDNSSAGEGSIGDFAFGLVKYPATDTGNSTENQEGLRFSGVFVERTDNGVSFGGADEECIA
ncbi:hypothetical protein V8E53_002341 [Lactarius tabidus]